MSYKWSDERLYWSKEIERLQQEIQAADKAKDKAAADLARRKLAHIWMAEVRNQGPPFCMRWLEASEFCEI